MPRERPPEDDITPYTDRLEAGPVDPEARRRADAVPADPPHPADHGARGRGGRRRGVRAAAVEDDAGHVDDSMERFREAVRAGRGSSAGLPEPGVYVLRHRRAGTRSASSAGASTRVSGGDDDHRHAGRVRDATAMGRPRGALGGVDAVRRRRPPRDPLDHHVPPVLRQERPARVLLRRGQPPTRPANATPGTTWTATCSGTRRHRRRGGGRGRSGSSSCPSAASASRTLHVQLTITFTGSTEGTREGELWLVAATGLPVLPVSARRPGDRQPLGQTHYLEQLPDRSSRRSSPRRLGRMRVGDVRDRHPRPPGDRHDRAGRGVRVGGQRRRAAPRVRAARHGRRGAHGDGVGERGRPGGGPRAAPARATTATRIVTARPVTAATTCSRCSSSPSLVLAVEDGRPGPRDVAARGDRRPEPREQPPDGPAVASLRRLVVAVGERLADQQVGDRADERARGR